MRSARNTAIRYPGSKARISPWIIDHLPAHNNYIEPFGGSAAVLLNKPPSPNEVYNDINGDLVHFFETLRDRGEELREWLHRTPYSRSLFEKYQSEFFEGVRPEDDVERAGRYFFIRQAAFNGKLSDSQTFRTTTEARQYESDSSSVEFTNTIENLEAFEERLRRVTIEQLSYEKVVRRYDSDTAAFYFDPPYVEVGEEYYRYGEFNHAGFFETIQDLDGYAIVSYEELPDATPDNWTVVSRASKSTLNQGNGETKDGTERLVLNFNPDQTPSFSEANQVTLSEAMQ